MTVSRAGFPVKSSNAERSHEAIFPRLFPIRVFGAVEIDVFGREVAGIHDMIDFGTSSESLGRMHLESGPARNGDGGFGAA